MGGASTGATPKMTQGQSARRPTRGVRNNNPGNIRRVPGVTWQGQAKDQTADTSFVVFVSAEMGVRALIRTLLTYNKAHKLKSVRAIIGRWAPPRGFANGRSYTQNTAAYIDAVAGALSRALGRTINADEALDLDRAAVMRPLVEAIIAHENNGYRYPASIIDEGLRLAGVSDAKPQPLLATGEAKGALITAPLAIAGAVETIKAFGEARDQLLPAASMSPLIQALIVLLSIAGCVVVLWSRFARQRKTLS